MLSAERIVADLKAGPEKRRRVFDFLANELRDAFGDREKGWETYCSFLDLAKLTGSEEIVKEYQGRFVDLLHPQVKADIGKRLLSAYMETIEKEAKVGQRKLSGLERTELERLRAENVALKTKKPWWKKLW